MTTKTRQQIYDKKRKLFFEPRNRKKENLKSNLDHNSEYFKPSYDANQIHSLPEKSGEDK